MVYEKVQFSPYCGFSLCCTHTLVDEVIVTAVTYGIGVVDDGDERCSAGLVGRIRLVNDVTLLGTGRKLHQGCQYLDKLSHHAYL